MLDRWDAVAVAVFLVGLIFAAGRMSARLESVEAWRVTVEDDLRAIRKTVDKIAGVLWSENRPDDRRRG